MVLHIFAYNCLTIQPIFNPKKVLESWDSGFSTILSIAMHVKGVKGYFDLWHLQHASTYIVFDGMVKKP